MDFYIKVGKENILSLIRRAGYSPTPYSFAVENNFNFVRPLAGRRGYPRFHIYVKEDEEKMAYLFSLHLDQKKVSYSGHSAHSGEYDGEIVEREAERIKNILE